MAIKITRNEAGNCINFIGSTNPVYWNGCLSAEINANNANAVNIKNEIRTVNVNEPVYEFFCIPANEFADKNGNGFATTQDCVDYINAQANVTGSTGKFVLDANQALDFSIDATATTILLDNGDNFPVNSISAQGNADGHIDISTHDGNIIIFKDLRLDKASIDNTLVTQTLATAVNELNSLFSQSGSVGIAPAITSGLTISLVRTNSLNYDVTGTNIVGYEWSNLPAGVISVNGGKSIVGGSTLNSGTYNITLRVVNYYGFDEKTVVLTVSQPTYADTFSVQFNNSDFAHSVLPLDNTKDFTMFNKASGQNSSAWTIAGWLLPSTSSTSSQYLFSCASDYSWNSSYWNIIWTGNNTGNRELQFTIGQLNDSSVGHFKVTTNSGNTLGNNSNTWRHIAITSDGVYQATDNDTIKVYIDGVRITGITVATGGGGFSGAFQPTLFRVNVSQTGSNYGKSCKFDEWGFFDTRYDDAGVTALYNSGSTFDLMTATTPPKHLYRFGDGDTFPILTDNAGSVDLRMQNMVVSDIKSDVP